MKAIFVTAAASILALPAAAEPVKIRVGHGAAAEEQLWLMKAKPDVTPNQGKAYTVDFVLFRGTDQRFKAVEAKELDVFTSSASSAVGAYSQGLRFKAFMADYVAATKFYVEQPAAARKALIAANFVRVPERLYVEMQDYYRNPTARIDVESLRKLQDVMAAQGYVKTKVNPAVYVDMSYLP